MAANRRTFVFCHKLDPFSGACVEADNAQTDGTRVLVLPGLSIEDTNAPALPRPFLLHGRGPEATRRCRPGRHHLPSRDEEEEVAEHGAHAGGARPTRPRGEPGGSFRRRGKLLSSMPSRSPLCNTRPSLRTTRPSLPRPHRQRRRTPSRARVVLACTGHSFRRHHGRGEHMLIFRSPFTWPFAELLHSTTDGRCSSSTRACCDPVLHVARWRRDRVGHPRPHGRRRP